MTYFSTYVSMQVQSRMLQVAFGFGGEGLVLHNYSRVIWERAGNWELVGLMTGEGLSASSHYCDATLVPKQ